ncbi:hypothetical protein ElyMa_006290600 [Elysia marginata]|uniref:Uncharacterized protein n=1 Tax=Elysia marginata TaxID=1093978 RepID=A0AAV4HD36_9GAST|nr:hypothetical protein ElyMa_006290600 [Elysia marginata]
MTEETLYSLGPDLRQGFLVGTAPSEIVYHIVKITEDEFQRARGHPDMSQTVQKVPLLKKRKQKTSINRRKVTPVLFPRNDLPDKLTGFNNRRSGETGKTPKSKSSEFMCCKVLAVIDTEFFRQLGITDPAVAASFITFSYQQVNQMLLRDDFIHKKIARLEIENISIYDNYASRASDVSSKDESSRDVTFTHNGVNVSDILCLIRSNQNYNKYCVVQTFFAYGNGGFLSATVFPDKGLNVKFPVSSKFRSQRAEMPGVTYSGDIKNDPTPHEQPRSFKMNSLMGCRQHELPLGVRISSKMCIMKLFAN